MAETANTRDKLFNQAGQASLQGTRRAPFAQAQRGHRGYQLGQRRPAEERARLGRNTPFPVGPSPGPLVDNAAVLGRQEQFVSTFTDKLMTYALGRAVEYYDQPAIRSIVADAKAKDYRFSSVVLGIVNSTPFQMRRTK